MKSFLMKKMMINCREATFLMSKKEEGKLSLIGQLKLSVHTSMCAVCKKFEQQITWIGQESREITSSETLTSLSKENLKKNLQDHSPME